MDAGHFNLQVAKRAYKRACRRAATSSAGGTWYRGRWVSSADLGSRYVSSCQPAQFSKAVAQDYIGDARAKHFSLFSWNAGGLAAHNWDGLQNWLLSQGIQICCIQETWWPYQSDCAYFAIHHGAARNGGLLTLISHKLASKECIRSGTLANGRVQHIRIYDSKGVGWTSSMCTRRCGHMHQWKWCVQNARKCGRPLRTAWTRSLQGTKF